MTVPYFAFQMVVLTREDTGVNGYADLKGKKLGNTSGTYEAIALEKDQKAWGEGSFRAYQSQNDTILALSQGHIDATVVTNTVAAATLKSGKYKGLKVAGDAPTLSTTCPWPPSAASTACSTTSTCSSTSRCATAATTSCGKSGWARRSSRPT